MYAAIFFCTGARSLVRISTGENQCFLLFGFRSNVPRMYLFDLFLLTLASLFYNSKSNALEPTTPFATANHAQAADNVLVELVSHSRSMLMEQMTAGKFRHLPVMDDDRLVGIISIGDVVKYRLTELEFEKDAMRDYIQTA